ncbi:MAG: CoA-binding protein [Tissierellales bacterium]|jgi:predicted CoA-binding protein|nr:CoA-binding protein [Tissierellales bacterium]
MDLFEKYKKEMLDKKIWAIVGVTENKERFGYKIWKLLRDRGYNVYGVNPKYSEIEGEKIYKTLADLPEKVEVVNVIVNPKISLLLLDEIEKQGIEYAWFQPGSLDEDVLDKAESTDLKFVYHECVYAELK